MTSVARTGEAADDGLLDEMPVVLTASRIAQSPLDAPAPVMVIDRETIRASGFTEIHDVMRLVPGFQVADWARSGAVVTNHGLGSAYPHSLLVLLDGRSVVDPVLGSVDWQDLPIRLEDIERIEVVRGPNQASYGALAFNGVVNIITRMPGDDDSSALLFSRGERGFADHFVRLDRRGDRLDWRISASDRKANPFRDRDEIGYYRAETNERQTLRAELSYRLDRDQELFADFGLTRGEDWLGSSKNPATEPYHTRDIAGEFLQLVWRKSYAPDSELSLRYFHYHRDKQEEFLAMSGAVLANLDLETRRDDLELQQVHRFSDVLQGVWGAGLRRDEINSPHYFYGVERLDGRQWQVFGNLGWQFAPDWLLHTGAMVEQHYNTDALFSPRLALNYSIDPYQSIRLSVGKGFRAPTFAESDVNEVYTAPNGLPLPVPGLSTVGNVDPEQVRFWDAGYIGHIDRLGLRLDTRLYSETYSDIIWNPGRVYQNIDQEIRVRGGEAALDWKHDSWGRFRFSHSLIDIQGGGDEFGNDADRVSHSAPTRSTSLLWSKSFPYGIGASLGYYHVGDMGWLGEGSDQPAYERVDARLAKRFGKVGKDNEIALTVQNLNGKHIEFLSGETANYTERQGFITLRLGW
jgi:iron complex outermembrane receptor protein